MSTEIENLQKYSHRIKLSEMRRKQKLNNNVEKIEKNDLMNPMFYMPTKPKHGGHVLNSWWTLSISHLQTLRFLD